MKQTHLAKTIKFNRSALVLTAAMATASSFAVANDTTNTNTQPISNSTSQAYQQPVTVYFLNGIFNTETQSQTSAIALFHRLKDDPKFAQLVVNHKVSLKTLYNPTDPWLGDLYELQAQANIQKQALKATKERLAQETANHQYDNVDIETLRQAIFQQEIHRANQLYKGQHISGVDFIHKAGNRAIENYSLLADEVYKSLSQGEQVVIVAHSQGNYVAQGLYAKLLHVADKDLIKQNLHVVGVANVAGTTPTNSYITNSEDKAVYRLHTMQGGQPMVANFKPIFANGYSLTGLAPAQMQNDLQNHGFIETYLSARFNNKQEFVPHSPEIVEKVEKGQPSTSIYQKIVDKVMAGIKFIQQA